MDEFLNSTINIDMFLYIIRDVPNNIGILEKTIYKTYIF